MEEPELISKQVNKDYVIHCDASNYCYSRRLQQTRPGMDELGNENGTLQRRRLMLPINQPKGLHSISQEQRLQALVIINPSRTSLKVE